MCQLPSVLESELVCQLPLVLESELVCQLPSVLECLSESHLWLVLAY